MTRPGPPAWLAGLPDRVARERPAWFTDFTPPDDPARSSAVLVLIGPASRPVSAPAGDHDVVLTERAHTLRSHAAQVAFPGGHVDPGDTGVVDAALREATEEVGLRRDSVDVVGTLPSVYMHPSRTAVTPVIAWWAEPHPVDVVDAGEVARVVRAPLAQLVDPANRFTVRAPRGYHGPGFAVAGLFVWGFTATLLDVVLAASGLAGDWDRAARRDLPEHMLAAYRDRGATS